MSSITSLPRGTLSRVAAPLAVLAGALLLAFGAVPAASAADEEVEFTLTFDNLMQDEIRTEAAQVTLSQDATLTSIEWVDRTGILADAQLDVSVCAGSVCASTDPFAPTVMAAGTLDVAVTVHVAPDAPSDSEGAALGRLTFVEYHPDVLPPTGIELNAAALWGMALIAVGVLLSAVTTARASRRQERP